MNWESSLVEQISHKRCNIVVDRALVQIQFRSVVFCQAIGQSNRQYKLVSAKVTCLQGGIAIQGFGQCRHTNVTDTAAIQRQDPQ
jgi:hypothetical protein